MLRKYSDLRYSERTCYFASAHTVCAIQGHITTYIGVQGCIFLKWVREIYREREREREESER